VLCSAGACRWWCSDCWQAAPAASCVLLEPVGGGAVTVGRQHLQLASVLLWCLVMSSITMSGLLLWTAPPVTVLLSDKTVVTPTVFIIQRWWFVLLSAFDSQIWREVLAAVLWRCYIVPVMCPAERCLISLDISLVNFGSSKNISYNFWYWLPDSGWLSQIQLFLGRVRQPYVRFYFIDIRCFKVIGVYSIRSLLFHVISCVVLCVCVCVCMYVCVCVCVCVFVRSFVRSWKLSGPNGRAV
jgi:hypothetical protein